MHYYHPPVPDGADRRVPRRPPPGSYDRDDCAAPCPRCRAPMALRYGRHGPYYHCACPQTTEEEKSE